VEKLVALAHFALLESGEAGLNVLRHVVEENRVGPGVLVIAQQKETWETWQRRSNVTHRRVPWPAQIALMGLFLIM
jgi:hypothetical protein